MLPFRLVAPIGRTAVPEGARGRIRALALTSLALAVLCVLVGGTASGVVLALAVTALGAAAVLALRARWAAEAPPAPAAPGPAAAGIDAVASDSLTERLRRLHDDHVEAVNMAIGEGREDLAQELSDSYMNQALGMITGGGSTTQDQFPLR